MDSWLKAAEGNGSRSFVTHRFSDFVSDSVNFPELRVCVILLLFSISIDKPSMDSYMFICEIVFCEFFFNVIVVTNCEAYVLEIRQ